jgi:hypothetical protein
MALSQPTLETDLLALFTRMTVEPMTKETYAKELAALLVRHIQTAAIPVGKVMVPSGGSSSPNTEEVNVE